MTLRVEPEPYRGVISTGSLGLDAAIGIGGIPCGRITEIYGREASSKTTLALHVVREAQKLGKTAAFVDTEYSFNESYAQSFGVNTEELMRLEPDTGESALQCMESVIEAGVDVAVLDSVAALVPKDEFEGVEGQKHMALLARLMSQAMRMLVGRIAESGTAVIFINQIRKNVGILWGNPEFTPGGMALKFYDALRIEVRRVAYIMNPDKTVRRGDHIVATITKNKFAPPHRSAEFDVLYGRGISREYELLRLGERQGIITKSGPYYRYGETELGRGFEAAVQFLTEHRDVHIHLTSAIQSTL